MSSRTAFIAGAIAFTIGAVALVAAVLNFSGGGQVATQTSTVGGPFRMVDEDGKPVTEQDLKGKPHVVFFGFTHCPDVCPTALFDLTQAFNAMGADAAKVGGVFVTVDPARDTPEVMKGYLSSFSPLIRGFTGSEEQVAEMVKAYRVFRKKVPLDSGDYTMDHTAVVYLMDRNGAFVAPLNMKRPPEEIAAEIRRYG